MTGYTAADNRRPAPREEDPWAAHLWWRLGRGDSHARSARHPARWPTVLGWSTGVALAVAGLLFLAHLTGNGEADGASGFWASLEATAERPAVSAGLAFALLAFGAWCLRRVLLELLAWWPGRIDVPDFRAGSGLEETELAQVTMRFRHRLAKLRLQGNDRSAVPGVAPAGDFVDVLQRGGVDGKGVLGTLLGLLRAAVPTHAYEVSGVAFRRAPAPSYGITVQVSRLPSLSDPPLTVFDTSWEGVCRRAADQVTAAVLPRTRRCQRPWTAWRGRVMPPTLLERFELAMDREESGRFDEALGLYHEALDLDPMNLGIRLQIGFLEERLGLFLDALAGYDGMLAITHPAGRRGLPRRLYSARARRARRRILLVARYRRAVLLAGDRVAGQWRRGAAGPPGREGETRRDRQRARLRAQLRPSLKAAVGRSGDTADARRLLAEPKGMNGPGDALEPELRRALQLAAADELRELRTGRAGTPFGRPIGWWRSPVSRKAILLAEACVRRRLALDDRSATATAPGTWTASPAELEHQVHRIGGFRGLRRWQEQYNAACVFALALMDGSLTKADARVLGRLAVERLELAAACADSAYVAQRRDWLVSEDPDLEGLRPRAAFKRFEARYFPSATATPSRPRGCHEWEMSRYVRDLLVAAADRREAIWHRRRRELPDRPDNHEMLRWWKEEADAWRLVRGVAVERRHWKTRADFVAAMTAWSLRAGLDGFAVRFPTYSDPDLKGDEELKAIIAGADARLDLLAAALDGGRRGAAGRRSLPAQIERRRAELRELDVRGECLERLRAKRRCDEHAAHWQRLKEWLEEEPGPAPSPARAMESNGRRSAFIVAVLDTRRLTPARR